MEYKSIFTNIFAFEIVQFGYTLFLQVDAGIKGVRLCVRCYVIMFNQQNKNLLKHQENKGFSWTATIKGKNIVLSAGISTDFDNQYQEITKSAKNPYFSRVSDTSSYKNVGSCCRKMLVFVRI